MLIGVELFNEILLPNSFSINKQLPILRDSYFGYLIFGKLKFKISRSYISKVNLSCDTLIDDNNLNILLQRFWQIDQITTNSQTGWSPAV